MFIEAAFFTTMSTLVRQISHPPNEERIRGIFFDKIYEQFQLLHWDKAGIYSQCNYDHDKRFKADLKIKYLGLPGMELLSDYGIKQENWIEIKYYNQQGSTRIDQEIKKDILRLCLLIEEHQEKHRDNGRYLLLVCNAKNNKSQFIKDLYKPGKGAISFEEIFGLKRCTIQMDTLQILPNKNTIFGSRYDASLINIKHFKVCDDKQEFEYKPMLEEEDLKNQKAIISIFTGNLRSKKHK